MRPLQAIHTYSMRASYSKFPSKEWDLKKKKRFAKYLRRRAAQCKAANHRSDLWFMNLWIKYGMFIESGPRRDRFNESFQFYIPDMVNFYYRYVVEVDGSIHNTGKQKKIDKKKDVFYKKSGYRVFRIHPGDLAAFMVLKKEIQQIRSLKKEEPGD